MASAVPLDVTQFLRNWSRSSQAALNDPLIYRELQERARNYLRHERPDHTLQPTL